MHLFHSLWIFADKFDGFALSSNRSDPVLRSRGRLGDTHWSLGNCILMQLHVAALGLVVQAGARRSKFLNRWRELQLKPRTKEKFISILDAVKL